jgi:hypothetical protein
MIATQIAIHKEKATGTKRGSACAFGSPLRGW